MHDRRARPTLRVLSEDLGDGWTDPAPSRAISQQRWRDLHPLSDLPHPLIHKAQTWFGSDPAGDSYHEKIKCAQQLGLLEIAAGQWRGAIWQDPETGVRWLCAAGLAKGNHQDNDDFYVVLASLFQAGNGHRLLPTGDDLTLLRRETAAKVLTAWEIRIQQHVLEHLDVVAEGGRVRFDIFLPSKEKRLATVIIDVATEPGGDYDLETCLIEIRLDDKYRGSDLGWDATVRILISVWPPTQGWDRVNETYSTMLEPGDLRRRVAELAETVKAGDLVSPVPGVVSHYAHTQHLSDHTVNGKAVRGLCGVFFVPTQDHESFPECPECSRILTALPT